MKPRKPRAKVRKRTAAPKTGRGVTLKKKIYVTYPPELLQEPLIYWVGHKFKVITNICGGTVSDESGLAVVELQGSPDQIDGAISWLRSRGVKVDFIVQTMAG